MTTAGRAVVSSGVTVALGLVTLIVLPVGFVRGIGIGGMLIPLISCTAALTVVPALLAGGARRLDWRWALANRASDGTLPAGREIARQHGRRERWGRLVKSAGLADEFADITPDEEQAT